MAKAPAGLGPIFWINIPSELSAIDRFEPSLEPRSTVLWFSSLLELEGSPREPLWPKGC